MDRRVTFLLVLAIAGTTPSAIAAGSFYVAQNAQGSGDGTSCASARAISWFNSSGNWGSAANQIGPGTTIQLCGTITSSMTFQGSGSSGNYITVDGGNATMAAGFAVPNRSWWKIQNVVFADGRKSALIEISGGSNGVFTGNYADDVVGDPSVWLGQYNGTVLPSNITISNNFIRTTAANIGNIQLDIVKTEGSRDILVEGNYLEMRAGGSGSSAHDDAIQTYEKGGTSGGPPSSWTIRYNKIVMNSSASADRSWTMLENLTGTNYIYRNVFLGIQGAGGANGLCINTSASGAIFHIYSNTFVAKGGASNNTMNLVSPGTAYLRNNVVHTVSQTALTGNMSVTRDHNLWYGSNIPSCSGRTGEICGKDPQFVDYANNDFSLRAGSPAIDAGVDLGSTYESFLATGATWPGPALGKRAANSAWSMSAFGSSDAAPVPLPPTDLQAQ